MELKEYQKKALQNGIAGGLLPKTLDALKFDEKKIIVLKAITGSGKTLIASEYIERVLTAESEDRGESPLCVIWLSKGNGMLHIQSSEKIKNYIKSPSINIYGIEISSDFKAQRFYDKDVYVINWEKLYSDNNLVSESEDANIPSALRNTSSDMRYILIVDEFHAGYEQETYKRIVNLFDPLILLGMSATPTKEQLLRADERVTIRVKDIQAEAMVKKGIKFNAQVDIPTISEYKTQEEYFLRLALKRRDLLEEQYKEEGANITPLLLIQFDDEGKGKDVESLVTSITDILDSIYSNNANNDYAIWMDVKKGSVIKRSDDNIIKNLDENKVKILLFKQAIATGWDCPRAQVILRFRKIKEGDGTFDLQTLGRIFRMPEPDKGEYYKNTSLNYGYVYSLDNALKLEQRFSESLDESGDKDAFDNTVDCIQDKRYAEAVKEFERLISEENNTVVTEKAGDDQLCDQVEWLVENEIKWIFDLPQSPEVSIFPEASGNVDYNIKLGNTNNFSVVNTPRDREMEVKRLFEYFIPLSYSNTVRDQIKTSIRNKLNNDKEAVDERNMLILNNRDGVGQLMKKLDEYKKKMEFRKTGKNTDFVFPKTISVLASKKYDSQKGLYGVSSKDYSHPEKIFISKLDENPNVRFWYKNKDSGHTAFCVAYQNNQQTEPTYPDFIVAFTDGTYGIYEIKDEGKIELPKDTNKQNGIEKRVRELNKKNKDKFHGTLLKVNIKNEVVIDMESYKEFQH